MNQKRRRTDSVPRVLRDWLTVIVLFGMLAIMNIVSGLAANQARAEAKKVRTALEEVNVTAQNRCIIRVILSFPPPVSEGEFDTVLGDYDACIEKETDAVRAEKTPGKK